MELFAAAADIVIPIDNAKVLAASKPAALFHIIAGDHNDWADGAKVRVWYRPEHKRAD